MKKGDELSLSLQGETIIMIIKPRSFSDYTLGLPQSAMKGDYCNGIREEGEECVEDPSTRIRDILQRHQAFGIDTMAFIYHFEETPVYATSTKALFEFIEAGEAKGITSTLS